MWSDCLNDGEDWSQLLWAENKTGPAKKPGDTLAKSQSSPSGTGAQAHADAGGESAGSAGSSSKDKSLLQMWQSALQMR